MLANVMERVQNLLTCSMASPVGSTQDLGTRRDELHTSPAENCGEPQGMQRKVILKEFGIPIRNFSPSSDGPYKYYLCDIVMYVKKSSLVSMYSEICCKLFL